MVSAISDYCRQTGQVVPDSPAAFARGILESLAFKYRVVIESLESLTGNRIEEIRIVGGGSRNRLLNQFTADATGCTVIAGPWRRPRSAISRCRCWRSARCGSLDEARRDHRALVPGGAVRTAIAADVWDAQYARFQDYVEMTCV